MVSKHVEKVISTLTQLAGDKATSKQMFRATRRRHPKATKKEIIRAAFDAFIETADKDPNSAKKLQNFALSHRAGDADEV